MGGELDRHIADLQPGDHLCLISEALADQMGAIVPFLKDGLARGERCAYIADDGADQEVLAALAGAGMAVDWAIERGALLFLTKRETYLRSGAFGPAAMITFLSKTIDQALADGFRGLRVTGEMIWQLGTAVGDDRLIEYEALLNTFFPGRPVVAICQYSRRRLAPAIIRDVLRTHPVVIIGDRVCPNLYYEPPEMVIGEQSEAHRVDWMLAQLKWAQTMEGEIRRLNEGLERRVRERTAQLEAANEALKQQMAERERAEQELRLHAAALAAAANAIVIADRDGTIKWVNPAFSRLTGYTAEEAIGHNPRILRSGRQDPRYYQQLWTTILAGQVWHGELINRRKDGSLYTEEMTITPVRDPSGEIVSFVGIKQDVTARKQAEEEIVRLNEDLQRRARELESANKELEAFSYSVSHDLRAPLRSIDGFSQALLEDCADRLDAEGRSYLQRVRAASQRMAHLIDDLLNLSRISRREMSREPVDLSALARAIAGELRQAQPERQVEFAIAEGLVVHGDAQLLRVMLENLLGNAWKFTSKHPRARVEFGVAAQGGKATYFVRDDGAGFDMAYADKLFGAFQRLHAAQEFDGTGIGLATVQRIVHRHGGRVWAEGAVERGATFYFTL